MKRVLLSRTDSIGDVILTLPLAGIIKKQHPDTEVLFLGRTYTEDVVGCCDHVDRFVNYDELLKLNEPAQVERFKSLHTDTIVHVFPQRHIARLAKKARIPNRYGTTGRLYHWTTCNRLVRLSRRNSGLHEAQLNIKLAESITGVRFMALDEIHDYYGFNNIPVIPEQLQSQLSTGKTKVILHPKSKGSAREWGLDNFSKLIQLLPRDHYKVFITGTAAEGSMLEEAGFFGANASAVNLTGKMSLNELIAFIARADALVAASTGPLHIAAATGIKAIGLYPPIRPMHPGRWAPLGKDTHVLCLDKSCDDCRKEGPCVCMEALKPEEVTALL